ncbi:MAG: hypothetical protein CMI00_14750 [Oceanospirillaceae bacterium]|nr:hypothetical protein [Oceanospirillaceae bacterium]MAR01782.1 hypothetical protein [Oceanospirillaceae bacterium]
MSEALKVGKEKPRKGTAIGVGLRHAHFRDVLTAPAPLDFVEVHSENFFGKGGAARAFLLEVAQYYPVSLHSTAMGLGSESAIPDSYMPELKRLAEDVEPCLISDHVAFSRAEWLGHIVHSGDLLPVVFDRENLFRMVANIDHVQKVLGRRLLLENLSAYLTLPGSEMSETEFLTALTQETGCGLLVDLNNLYVNAKNQGVENVERYVRRWLESIPAEAVGELHLAGCSPVAAGELMIDDHARPVADEVWWLYAFALERFGPVPTLIEWDNDLPDWQVLTAEAEKARKIAEEVLPYGH